MKICIFEWSNEKKIISRKLKYIFTKKIHQNYQDILHIGLQKYESRSEIEFWAGGGGEGVRLHLGCTSVRQNNQPRGKYAKLSEWVIIIIDCTPD